MKVMLRGLFGVIGFPVFAFVSPAHAQPAPPPVAFVQASNVACKVGRPNVKPRETVTWSGQCVAGLAEGSGTAQWFEDGKPTLRFDGTFARGLLEGKGRMVGADGDRYEGNYHAGLRHGHGVYTPKVGERFEGEYVNNQRVAASPRLSPANQPTAQNQGAPSTPPVASPPRSTSASAIPPTAATTVSPPRPASGDVAMLRCEGELATVAMATKEPTALPNDDAFTFGDDGRMPGANPTKSEAVAKSNAVRLLKEALVFAGKNRPPNCRLGGSMPPIISEIVLLFKDRIPEKVPVVGKDTAASVPGLLVYAEHGIGTWHLYNIGYQRAKVDAGKRKDQAKEAALAQFIKKHDLVVKEPKGLYANPFAFEGNKLFLVVGFEQMQSATTGLFYLPDEGVLMVNDIPKGAFSQRSKVLLAAKVLGNVKFDGVVEGLMQVHGMVPNLKFLGAIICHDDPCDHTDEK
jgi:hypothetical protein